MKLAHGGLAILLLGGFGYLGNDATAAAKEVEGDGCVMGRYTGGAEVVDNAGAWVDYHHITHTLRQIELGVEIKVFVLIARTDNFNHGLGDHGEGIVLKVPVGTIVYDEDTGEIVHDFANSDDRIVIARGGRGGRGGGGPH